MAQPEREPYLLGEFWDPTKDAVPSPGLLEGLATDRPLLRLITALPDAQIGWDMDQVYPVLCGRSASGGPEVTIVHSESLGRLSPDAGQDLWCQRVLTGAALRAEDLVFKSATVEISHLQEWAIGITPPAPTPEPPIYQQVAGSAVAAPGVTVEVHTVGSSSWDARGTHPERRAQLHLAFDSPQTFDQVDVHLQRALTMITFLTARANYFHRVSVVAPAATWTLEVSGRSRFYRLGETPAAHHWSGMLLTSGQDEFKFDAFVPAWFELQERLGRAAYWIFEPYYDEDSSIEQQYLGAAQAVEAVHNQLAPPAADAKEKARDVASRLRLDTDTDGELTRVRSLVKGVLFNPTLQERYREVVDAVGVFAEPPLVIEPDGFCERCADLRNLYTHWAEPRKDVRPGGVDELVALTRRLRLIFEAYMLVQLGLQPSEIKFMSRARPEYASLTRMPYL